ncbi:MAG: thiamine phosphate synthase [Clostridium sp.]|nr:thiamine phosphate synthase [Prevotella sp.]MCM1429316.1 thiamine phosphate synthase [Clostridium sp.]MCM1475651.1 thiamine phosphate synthase [Muribaculaceae bacterium]
MILIAVTSPAVDIDTDSEADRICRLLNEGVVDYVHIRKPSADSKDVSKLLSMIPETIHQSLTLHEHYELAEKFPIGGLHLKSSGDYISLPKFNVEGRRLRLSKSMHSLDEINEISEEDCYTYVSLSPVYDSLSKTGYMSHFSLEDPWLRFSIKTAGLKGTNVMALGGVVPTKLSELHEVGFDGAMMLGYIWNNPEGFDNVIDTIKNMRRCYSI